MPLDPADQDWPNFGYHYNPDADPPVHAIRHTDPDRRAAHRHAAGEPMSTPTSTEAAVGRHPGLKYVLLRAGKGIGTDETLKTEDVTGTVDDLTTGLRPWLLAHLRNGFHDDGWYVGCLVAANSAGVYDTYLSLATEDVLWYWDKECAPVPS